MKILLLLALSMSAHAGTMVYGNNTSVVVSDINGQPISPLTVSASSITITSMVQGSVIFGDGGGQLAQDNPNLFWDDTNNRLGVGTNKPSAGVHIASNTLLLNGNGAKIEVSSGSTLTTLTNCGSDPVVAGPGFGLTDTAGRFKGGSIIVTSCVLTFATPWTNIPICMFNGETTGVVGLFTPTTTAITFQGGQWGGAEIVDYICFGRR